MNRVDSQYQDILTNILEFGDEREDRTGTGTLSYFGGSFRHCFCDGFPVLTTKKMPLKTIATELKWFLKGRTDIQYLWDNNCHIWDGDYKKSGRTDGELGPIYGKQWRDWNGIDQLTELLYKLKEQPHGRRHLVNAWNVEDLHLMTLPPCHYSFQCYVSNDNKLSLLWNQRSVDAFLGLPFNITSYGMLLMVLCHELGYEPGELIGNFGDVHLYKNHIPQAEMLLERVGYTLPDFEITSSDILNGEFEYEITNYNHHDPIKAELSN